MDGRQGRAGSGQVLFLSDVMGVRRQRTEKASFAKQMSWLMRGGELWRWTWGDKRSWEPMWLWREAALSLIPGVNRALGVVPGGHRGVTEHL